MEFRCRNGAGADAIRPGGTPEMARNPGTPRLHSAPMPIPRRAVYNSGRHARIPLLGRRRTPETDANHCHSAPMADQLARDALSSLPKP